ncbi:MAG: acylphosphatase [Candidatus Thorarchaeota archaeon]
MFEINIEIFDAGIEHQKSSIEMSQTAKHIIFVGRVQGVGFRFTAYHIANRHKLTGFVRNCIDGTVEMLAQGPDTNIDNCIREIKDSFPGYIRENKIEEIPIDPRYTDFKITF